MLLLLRIVLLALAVIVLAVGAAYAVWSASIGADMAALERDARPPADAAITADRLAALPEPAIRYFTRAGVVGTTIPRLVRLTQKGRIRSSADAGWMTLQAEEVYSTNPPALVWRAGMPGLALPMVLGRDEYLRGEGSIAMRMLAIVPVADEHGDELRAAGLMRYLNEMMWFPAAYLGENITITPAGEDSFGVRITDRGLTAEATLFVDAEGKLINFRADRYNTATRSIERWETPISAWSTMAGLELPIIGAADWKLPAGDLRYIELEITAVSYEP
jgi:hypothetical protein